MNGLISSSERLIEYLFINKISILLRQEEEDDGVVQLGKAVCNAYIVFSILLGAFLLSILIIAIVSFFV